jgi:hypothetical protein
LFTGGAGAGRGTGLKNAAIDDSPSLAESSGVFAVTFLKRPISVPRGKWWLGVQKKVRF